MADILTNPKARRDYHILETFEAGIVLKGTGVDAFWIDLVALAIFDALVLTLASVRLRRQWT